MPEWHYIINKAKSWSMTIPWTPLPLRLTLINPITIEFRSQLAEKIIVDVYSVNPVTHDNYHDHKHKENILRFGMLIANLDMEEG